MSIIAEALKKAQDQRSLNQKSGTSVRNEFVIKKPYGPVKGKSDSPNIPDSGLAASKGVLYHVRKTKRDRSLLITVFSVLSVFIPLSFLLFYRWSHPRENVDAFSAPRQISLNYPAGEDNSENGIIPDIGKGISAGDPTGKDPEQVPAEAPDAAFPTVSGIMYNSEKPRAVVNGVLCSEGDILGTTRILRIFPQSVVVVIGGEEHEISLR